MSAHLLDPDIILSGNEQWMKLDQQWGKPVDLETEDDGKPPTIPPVLSTWELRTPTFDSSVLLKKVRRKVGRQLSKRSTASVLDYQQFLEDLKNEEPLAKGLPLKQFYFISGQIISALSIEEICDEIDDIFKSIEKLCSATSTIRQRKKQLPDVIQCSISGNLSDLSFDDTIVESETEAEEEKEKTDTDDVDKYIDEAFRDINSTVVSISADADETTSQSVTTLVKKFSGILNSPSVNCSPRRQRQCCDRFKELAEFWKNKASGDRN